MRNQNGVTVTALVAAVITIAIIIGSISYNSMSSLEMKLYYNMCADIEILDEKIAIYYLENKELPVKTSETKNVTELIEGYSSANVNYNPNNSGILYKIDLGKLDNLSLNYTDYYIDNQSHTIYFLNGINIEGELYYTTPIDYQKVDLSLYP